jgi:hypothetical protein
MVCPITGRESYFCETGKINESMGVGATSRGFPGEREKMHRRSLRSRAMNLDAFMLEYIESLKTQTFVGLDEEGLRQQEELLKRIREVSAAFLAASKRDYHSLTVVAHKPSIEVEQVSAYSFRFPELSQSI